MDNLTQRNAAIDDIKKYINLFSDEELLVAQELLVRYNDWQDEVMEVINSSKYGQELKTFLSILAGLGGRNLVESQQDTFKDVNLSIVVRAIETLLKSRILAPSDFKSCYSLLTCLMSAGIISSYAVEHMVTKRVPLLVIRVNVEKDKPAFIVFETDESDNIVSSVCPSRPSILTDIPFYDA